MKKIVKKIKLMLIVFPFMTLISCGNDSLFFENFTKIIESKSPLKPVDSFLVNNNNPDDIMIYDKDSIGNFKSITINGGNSSGDFGGISSMILSFDKEKELIVVETLNYTGSLFNGYENWKDTFYLSFKKSTVLTKKEDENGEFIGLSLRENPDSFEKTSGYIGYIVIYKNKPNVIKVRIEGGGESDWNIHGNFYFKEKNLINEFDILRNLISEKNK